MVYGLWCSTFHKLYEGMDRKERGGAWRGKEGLGNRESQREGCQRDGSIMDCRGRETSFTMGYGLRVWVWIGYRGMGMGMKRRSGLCVCEGRHTFSDENFWGLAAQCRITLHMLTYTHTLMHEQYTRTHAFTTSSYSLVAYTLLLDSLLLLLKGLHIGRDRDYILRTWTWTGTGTRADRFYPPFHKIH